jgi:argininosuccinate lyase
MKIKKLWGKRFEKEPSSLAEALTSGRDVRGGLPADERLIPYDLWGSRAHAVMLAEQKIIPKRAARTLIMGLREIEVLWGKGEFKLDPSKEDVHSNVESFLIEKFGIEVGGRLHTARSRNDQVALDMRLYLRDCALQFLSSLTSLVTVLVDRAEKDQKTILPGYTHHQPAQVTTLGQIWLSFAEALSRDGQRFQDWSGRFNQNPLGSMTGYSTSFPINRELTSDLLGFDRPCANSLDPIQNRWEPEADLGFAIAVLMNHVSSLAQTLILLSTQEYGFFLLDDAYCSGSSMMPQKRNPDPLEVMKGKAAVIQGLLVSLLSIGRSLFLGYNRDTQWTKYLIMDLADESLPTLAVMSGIMESVGIQKEKMALLANRGFIGTPDLVERMVQEWGLPFRQAKIAVEKAVKYSEVEKAGQVSSRALRKALSEEGLHLPVKEKFLLDAQNPELSVSRRKSTGGTSPQALQKNIRSVSQHVQGILEWVGQKKRQQGRAKNLLTRKEREL